MSVERRKGGRKKDTKDAVDGEDVTETYNRLSKNKTPKPNRSMNHSPTSLLKKKKNCRKWWENTFQWVQMGSRGHFAVASSPLWGWGLEGKRQRWETG